TRRNNARAIRSEQTHVGEVLDQAVIEARLVLRRHALGDDGDEVHTTLGRLHDRALYARCRHENAGRRRASPLDRLAYGRKDRNALDLSAGALRIGACDDLGAISAIAQPIKPARRTSESLIHNARVLVDEDAHAR